MNFEEFKKKAEAFFEQVKPEEIVNGFKDLGLCFEDEIVYEFDKNKEYNFTEVNLVNLDGESTNFSMKEIDILNSAA